MKLIWHRYLKTNTGGCPGRACGAAAVTSSEEAGKFSLNGLNKSKAA